jgi:hypothetical protein
MNKSFMIKNKLKEIDSNIEVSLKKGEIRKSYWPNTIKNIRKTTNE